MNWLWNRLTLGQKKDLQDALRWGTACGAALTAFRIGYTGSGHPIEAAAAVAWIWIFMLVQILYHRKKE